MPNISNFFQDAYPATDELQCIKVYIPAGDEFKWLLAGLLRLPTLESSYQDPDSEQAQGLADIWRDAYDTTDWNGCGTPPECEHVQSETTIAPVNMSVESGPALTLINQALMRTGVYWRQSPANVGDAMAVYRFLAAGTWAYRITCAKHNAAGKIVFSITENGGSDVLQVTHDLYNATTLFNQYFTGTFTVINAAQYEIRYGTTTKNPSSSDEIIDIALIEMWRTGD